MIIAGNVVDDTVAEAPGEWCIRPVQQGDRAGPFFYFGCPKGRGTCGVPLAPSPPNPNGAVWTWDGNTAAPSISPSVNCVELQRDGEPAGGCGFHKTFTKGQWG